MATDWTWNWFTQLPPVFQGGYGSCEVCAGACYGAAMRAHIQGYPLRMLSQLYLYSLGQGGVSTIPHQVGRGVAPGAGLMQQYGCCLEELMPRPPWQGVDTTTQAYSLACHAALDTPPSAAAVADAQNQMVVDWQMFFTLYDGTMADMAVKGMAALDAGYILTAYLPPNHEVCVWGYDYALGWIGPDSRSMNAEATHWGFGALYLDTIIRSVVYKNATLGPKPRPLSKPIVIVTPPPPPPLPKTGNTQMLIDTIKAEANALILGSVTQAQIDALKADVGNLVPDAGTGPPPVGSWKIIQPDTTEHVDAVGTKWRARDYNGATMALLRNGGYEGITPVETYYPGTGAIVYARYASGWKYKWNGTAWVYMAAGEIPPGY